ncbi:uncharacterized protein Dmoj_GI20425, isoform B [Drosophila mojavensis]|uniref:Uncharacterized protein, isoform A n=1 Tax=Drosophila mojavensis TaxID=7230 RepID=B4KQS4_DROMO|nr:uncharacterized protein Dmoj_GI20425, isoform A [Drosophila mojavensis]KRG04559.1 uncharacterized protein Dmoj_GI20425, isoform B [Drosophila mojavensis]
MFGSKLRSWMETHIVRPRKKNNKNKQQPDGGGAGAGGGGSSSASHAKKAGTLPHSSNLKSTTSPVLTSSGSHSIASPVRRREVSPIQCHTPSRYGWQSPDQDTHTSITSPQSDNLLYAPHRYQCHQTLSPLQPLQPQQLSVPGKDSCSSTSADKSPMRVNCSSSSISSLSWSTGSKEPSMQSSQAKLISQKVEHIEISSDYQAPIEDEVDYEEVGALLLRPQAPMLDYQRPQSENLTSLQLVYEEEPQQQQSKNHVHYGRLLPSKLEAPPPPPPPAVSQQLSRLRAPRGMPRGNFVPGPRPHSLSSPESAYSTGYSTDGNSPCAASSANPPAPEYYINMRSGTHYFPSRSANTLATKFGLNRIEEMSPMDPLPKSNFGNVLEAQPSPLSLQRNCQLFESPSPRQRSRIRTNPWYNTTEHMQLMSGSRLDVDATSTTSTTSSGIKSSTELEMRAAKTATTTPLAPAAVGGAGGLGGAGGVAATPKLLAAAGADSRSEGSSSSSTEVENLHAPHTIKRRQQQQQQQPLDSFLVSDDEATLNEMIGKFDESYIYEKETDILSSDSDPTDCASELDTGQDAGDECDTDEQLDIDFIDTSSMQEIQLDMQQRNLGSCHYYPSAAQPSPLILRRASTRSRRRSGQEAPDASQQRRRKRFLKTRKKSCENREKVNASPLREPRGSRSVGGTPVCLRRHLLGPKERIYKTSPLSNRSNSLIFGSANEPHFMTIAESEKALLKADLEADMKYKQLIMEAESLLESMKNSLQSIPRDTPVASPRRLNPLANKRVEMLKHSEVEAKKQAPPAPPLEHELAAAINKRIEMLKFETAAASPPNSPKPGRCSPRKTHLTNFMNQNAPPELPPRKLNNVAPLSPQLQLNGRRLVQGSPRSSRRAMALHSFNASDSDQECIAVVEDATNHNYLPQQQEQQQQQHQMYNNLDYNNRNVSEVQMHDNFYCPHSEPLKRKVYKGSSSFERIKKTFDLELDMNERTKSHVKRQQSKLSSSVSAKSSMQDVTVEGATKQQLIVSTIVDLKRNLEHQSYELSGLTEE